MERRDLNHSHGQPQGPVEVQCDSSVARTDTSKSKDVCLRSLIWWLPANHPQFHGQTASFCTEDETPQTSYFPDVRAFMPTPELYGLSQERLPKMISEPTMTPTLGTFDEHFCDGSGALYKIHESSLGSFQSIATREGNARRAGFQPPQEADSSLFTWRSSTQLYHSRAATILSHEEEMSLCQSLPQQLEGTLGTVSEDTQEDPEPRSDLNAEYDDKTFWEQHCCADCGKQYRRVQELIRHTRDKHEKQRGCPFCDATWSRPEKIRGHLIGEHGDRLTEEDNQEIRRLRGWKNTIHFLTQLETATPPPRSSMLSAQAPVPPHSMVFSLQSPQ